jgi:hypothetical protein
MTPGKSAMAPGMAFLVSEQLALQQAGRHAGADDGLEGAVGAQ